MTDRKDHEDSERGARAHVDRRTGEVHGAGSGTGGGNAGEDYDNDPAAGSGEDPSGAPRDIDDAVDRLIDRDEGR